MPPRRAAATPRPKGRRWDRRQVLLALVAILIVVTMLASSMMALFYGSG